MNVNTMKQTIVTPTLSVATQRDTTAVAVLGPVYMGEGNPPGRVTLLGGLPPSIVFPGFVYMRGRVTPGGGYPYLLARVTLLGGSCFCLFKPCKRSG